MRCLGPCSRPTANCGGFTLPSKSLNAPGRASTPTRAGGGRDQEGGGRLASVLGGGRGKGFGRVQNCRNSTAKKKCEEINWLTNWPYACSNDVWAILPKSVGGEGFSQSCILGRIWGGTIFLWKKWWKKSSSWSINQNAWKHSHPVGVLRGWRWERGCGSVIFSPNIREGGIHSVVRCCAKMFILSVPFRWWVLRAVVGRSPPPYSDWPLLDEGLSFGSNLKYSWCKMVRWQHKSAKCNIMFWYILVWENKR